MDGKKRQYIAEHLDMMDTVLQWGSGEAFADAIIDNADDGEPLQADRDDLIAYWEEAHAQTDTHEGLDYDVFDLKSVATADAYIVCKADEADYLIKRYGGEVTVYLRRIDASDKKAVAQAVLDDHDIYVDAPRGKLSTGYRLLEIDGSPAVDEWTNREMWVEQSLDLYLECSGQTPDYFVMTVSEVAERYGIAETTIRSTIAQGYMPGAGWRKSGKTLLIQANAAAARWGDK